MTTGIANRLPQTPPAPAGAPAPAPNLPRRVGAIRDSIMEYCVPHGLERDTEPYRRARLITGFGLLGSIFGAIYATFYLLIGHVWGASVIIVCSVAVACVPLILRSSGSIRIAGNLLTLILVLGFGTLCGMEGGIRGHAIGWLAALPLCALLLVDGASGAAWCGVCVAVAAGFVIVDLCGIHMPILYPMRWHGVVTAAGYLGLTIFMSVLGLIFEGGRRRAFSRMERALGNLSDANARLKKLDAEKNEFLGVAAHDLKNPLNIILGFAELISTGRNNSPQRDQEDAGYIIQASERMISIITQLLDVNAIEQGRFPLEMAACDLGVISKQVTESYATAAAKKDISIYTAGSMEPAWIMADARATYRILDNLVSNAVKYSPPGGDVYVRMRNSPDGVIWEVQDRGAGLTETDKARLFQKFAKLSARPTGGESSTGLGLSIVKMLASAMQGNIECQSKRGEGSTFSVRLPSTEPPPEGQSALQALFQ